MRTVFFSKYINITHHFKASYSLSLPQAPKRAKKKATEGNSNVFSMFEQSQIQEFKEVGLFKRTFITQNWICIQRRVTVTHVQNYPQ